MALIRSQGGLPPLDMFLRHWGRSASDTNHGRAGRETEERTYTSMRKYIARLGAVCLIGTFGIAGAVPVVSSAHSAHHQHGRKHHTKNHSHGKQIHRLKQEINQLKHRLKHLENQGSNRGTQIRHLKSRLRKLERQLKHYKRGCRHYKRHHHYYVPPFCKAAG